MGRLSNLGPKIKTLKYITLVAALVSALELTAKADLVLSPFGDIPKIGTDVGGENDDNQPNNFFCLQNYIAAHRTFVSLDTRTIVGSVPDSGATVMLLGGALVGLGLLGHYLKR